MWIVDMPLPKSCGDTNIIKEICPLRAHCEAWQNWIDEMSFTSEYDHEAWEKMMSHKTHPLCEGCLFKKEVSEHGI